LLCPRIKDMPQIHTEDSDNFNAAITVLAETCVQKHYQLFSCLPSMKAFVTSLWLLTVFLANVFNTPLAYLYPVMNPGLYFAMLAGLLVLVAGVFYFVARRFYRLVS
jgi:hypothetical protein